MSLYISLYILFVVVYDVNASYSTMWELSDSSYALDNTAIISYALYVTHILKMTAFTS